jgi:ketol-acid reductoisomerase
MKLQQHHSFSRYTSSTAIVGLGNQARTWALNLQDSGRDFKVILRSTSSQKEWALNHSISLIDSEDVGNLSTISSFILLIPDHEQTSFLQDLQKKLSFSPHDLSRRIIYAHGYSYVQGQHQQLFPEWSHLLLAPKSIAQEMRQDYLRHKAIAGVYSLEGSHYPEEDKIFLLTLAKDLGMTWGPFPCGFEEEMKADLFSEQGLLCTLLPYAAKTCFDFLIKKGITPELAYLECWHEMKLIAQTLAERGPQAFFSLISPNAFLGSEKYHHFLMQGLEEKYQVLWNNLENKSFFLDVHQQSEHMTEQKQQSQDYWSQEPLNKVFHQMNNQDSSL